MDHVVRTVVWAALFGGTGAVIVLALPRIVIWFLEIIDSIRRTRSHKKTLLAPRGDTHRAVGHPPKSVHES
jgi:hypothetical protein